MSKALRALLALTVVAGAATLVSPVAAPENASAAHKGQKREFEGRVIKVKRAKGVFVMRTNSQRVGIKVNRKTRYEDVRGFNRLRKGMKVEVNARYNGKRWVALKVERDDGDDD